MCSDEQEKQKGIQKKLSWIECMSVSRIVVYIRRCKLINKPQKFEKHDIIEAINSISCLLVHE